MVQPKFNGNLVMGRLILVPQLPIRMRYQEWLPSVLTEGLRAYFDEIIVLGKSFVDNSLFYSSTNDIFSNIERAFHYEQQQMKEYLDIEIKKDDVLFLCDLSFPGLFSSVLMIKPIPKSYALCHATAANRYDFWANIRGIKYGVEKNQAKLFDKVFVGSYYHYQKLKWPNIAIVGMPHPPIQKLIGEKNKLPKIDFTERKTFLRSVARPHPQKVRKLFEKEIEEKLSTIIKRDQFSNWYAYFSALSDTQFVIITAREETYGYQAIDAMLCGAVPLAPASLSYPELIPHGSLYEPSSADYVVQMIKRLLFQVPRNSYQLKIPEDRFLPSLISEMRLNEKRTCSD